MGTQGDTLWKKLINLVMLRLHEKKKKNYLAFKCQKERSLVTTYQYSIKKILYIKTINM